MLGDFDDFDERAIGAGAAELHAVGDELVAVAVVELVAVAVAFRNFRRAVALRRRGCRALASSAEHPVASCRLCR